MREEMKKEELKKEKLKKEEIKKERSRKTTRTVCLSALVAASMMFGMAGCGSSSSYDSYATNNATASESAAYDYYDDYDSVGAAYYEDAEWDSGDSVKSVDVDESAAQAASGRKLIRTVNLDVETLEFDRVVTTVEEQTEALGGYIESMDVYNGSRYSYYGSNYSRVRNASMTIRIPKNRLDEFLNTVSGISNVVSRSESVSDVTLTYSDLESHKEVLRAEHARLLEFMEQAETIEDMLTIESRLSDIQYQLESMESQLRTYDNRVDYSTVYLSVDEVEELTPVEEEEQTAWERIAEGFTDNLLGVLNGLKEFIIWFIVHIPNLVAWAIFIGVIVMIVRAIVKSSRKRKAQKANVYAAGSYMNPAVAGRPVQPNMQRPAQPNVAQAAQTNAQPNAQQTAQPNAQQAAQPNTQPNAQQAAQQAAQPNTQQNAQQTAQAQKGDGEQARGQED